MRKISLLQFEIIHDSEATPEGDWGREKDRLMAVEEDHEILTNAVWNAIYDEVRDMIKRGDVTGDASVGSIRQWELES